MKRGRKWSLAAIVLGAIGTVAIVSPALGGPSLKQLVKKEVAKQIANATGPPGANGANGADGTNGTNGANGLDGTARAYATVIPHGTDSCTGGCTFDHAKGISSVTHPAAGDYCVTAPGINPAAVPALVSLDGAAGDRAVAALAAGPQCGPTGYEILTTSGSTSSDAVGFTIMIP
jgi:hypothetical protein